MISPDDAVAPAALPVADARPSAWRIAVLWLGVPACLLGMWRYDLWQHWAPGRTLELLVFVLAALALAWPLRRALRCSWATSLAVVWLAALVLFCGPLAVASTAMLALAAAALGGLLSPRLPVAAQVGCGLVLIGTALGWLLPMPVHQRWVYLAAFALVIVWRRASLREVVLVAREQWQGAVSASPRGAAFAVMVLGLASTGAWLPTLQVDDIGYHLRLPWQLLEYARYPLEADTHMWAFAPWLGDVLQAVPQIIGGGEARGPVNLLWIAVTAAGVWQLAVLAQVAQAGRWLAVALYASLPLTAVLAASMQTETPTAALLVWLVWAIARPWRGSVREPVLVAVLMAGLIALKLAAAAAALGLLPWVVWRHRRQLAANKAVSAATGLGALALGASSYVYAGLVAGNPFLPLFNAWFHSPYYLPANFDDGRWHAGFGPLLPWQMTFESPLYLEAYPGAAGFLLVVLAGAWLLALLDRRTLVLALVATALWALPLVALQYLRYALPAMVVLVPVVVAAALRVPRARGAALLVGLVVLNLVFQANGHWMLRTGAVKKTVLAAGSDEALFHQYAPERVLARMIRADGAPRGSVLALDPGFPVSAEFGARARTTSAYDPSLQAAALQAETDPSGRAWALLLARQEVSDVLLRSGSLSPPQRAGLELAGASLRGEAGPAQWWSTTAAPSPP